MKRILTLVAFGIMFALMLTGCADAAQVTCTSSTEHIYGFWGGTWHGMITIPSFFGSLIWNDVAIYAVNNNGAWYDFGFVGGFFIMFRFAVAIIKLFR